MDHTAVSQGIADFDVRENHSNEERNQESCKESPGQEGRSEEKEVTTEHPERVAANPKFTGPEKSGPFSFG